MNTGIYAIENTVNGKMYVGSAANLKSRKNSHSSLLRKGTHTNEKLQRSYNKHGEEAFKIRTLLVCRREDLLFYEQLAIDKFNAVKSGYNIAPIAGSPLGVKRTPEAKANYGAASKARWADPEFRTRVSAALRAGQASPEAKANYSAATKARWADPEFRAKMKIVQADPEYKARHAAAMKIVQADPEYKARHAAISKIAQADPEYKARQSAATKARWTDPEYRAKHAAAMKAYYATKKAA